MRRSGRSGTGGGGCLRGQDPPAQPVATGNCEMGAKSQARGPWGQPPGMHAGITAPLETRASFGFGELAMKGRGERQQVDGEDG